MVSSNGRVCAAFSSSAHAPDAVVARYILANGRVAAGAVAQRDAHVRQEPRRLAQRGKTCPAIQPQAEPLPSGEVLELHPAHCARACATPTPRLPDAESVPSRSQPGSMPLPMLCLNGRAPSLQATHAAANRPKLLPAQRDAGCAAKRQVLDGLSPSRSGEVSLDPAGGVEHCLTRLLSLSWMKLTTHLYRGCGRLANAGRLCPC